LVNVTEQQTQRNERRRKEDADATSEERNIQAGRPGNGGSTPGHLCPADPAASAGYADSGYPWRFSVIPDLSLPYAGQTIPRGGFFGGGPTVIRINPIQWAAVPDPLQQFTLDHELGHASLGHVDLIRAYGGNVPPQVTYKMEWDADEFAARAMTLRGQGAWVEAVAQFYLALAARGIPEAPLHTPYPVMAQHLRAVRETVSRGF
jgi:hypothetical protein